MARTTMARKKGKDRVDERDPRPNAPDPSLLVELARVRMPFGRYAGRRLVDLPEPYVVWFRKQGFPRGRLGVLLATLYEIKANGLEELLAPLREHGDPRYRPAIRSPRSDPPSAASSSARSPTRRS